MSGYDYSQKLQEWKALGFNPTWLTALAKEPAMSDSCGLRGSEATSVIKTLEGRGGIRRGPIQKNHKRLWLPGNCHDRWSEAAKNIMKTSEAQEALA